MRIIQFSDSFIPIMDGVGNVVYRYAVNFGKKGHESYVVAPQTNTGYRGNYPFEMIDYVGVPLWKMNSYTVGTPKMDSHFKKRLQMIDADIVHVHSPFMAGQAGMSYAKKRNIPVIGTFHSKYYDDFLQVTGIELLAEAGVKIVVDFYEKCDEVWAVSESSAQTLKDYGYEGSVRVMPNGTDTKEILPEKVIEIKEKLGIGTESILLFVGQMNWKKNIETTLRAFAMLNGDLKLVLAGRGPHEAEIKALAEKLGISDRVIMPGHITDPDLLNALYSSAQLFLFPSIYDNGPLVVREAAAAGTPSVVVRGSSAAECVKDGVNGLLCENDPANLAMVVQKALLDEKELEAMGKRAKMTIPIPWSSIAEDVLWEYKRVIERTKQQ
ncbi:MAG: glycosyltransferase [Oscillospiraceae bacterium]|nr:glycosyltransferase [Oscillospiraceae bacterium]MBQ2157509.1 glycosyltransferase [Oscillospiraceae bacterium]